MLHYYLSTLSLWNDAMTDYTYSTTVSGEIVGFRLSLIVALCYPVHFHLRIGFFWHLLLMTALSNFRYV